MLDGGRYVYWLELGMNKSQHYFKVQVETGLLMEDLGEATVAASRELGG